MIENYLQHAKEKALERYNLILTDEDCKSILDVALKDGKRLFQKDSLGRIVKPFKQFPVRVNYGGITFDIVISRKTGSWHLVTFLPKPKDKSLTIETKRRAEVKEDLLK